MKKTDTKFDKPCLFPDYWTRTDELICKVTTWFAGLLENMSLHLKRMIQRRAFYKFTHHFSLRDVREEKATYKHYNPYQGVNLLLVDKLVRSGEISIVDVIMDVGSGTGMFLLYLASRGFHDLVGVEYNHEIYEVCMSNIAMYAKRSGCKKTNFRIYEGNALDVPIDDDVTVFYLFNPFCDITTYKRWLNQVETSIERCHRKIKILLLRPTSASESAIRDCGWLEEKRRIFCERQIRHEIMFFSVFENC